MKDADQMTRDPREAMRGDRTSTPMVERWGFFEWGSRASTGQSDSHISMVVTFTCGSEERRVEGFDDGDGLYRVRFMPHRVGLWHFHTQSTDPALDGHTGSFSCIPAGPGNHGPVGVSQTFHFAYADGSAFRPFGTTCYAWIHQPAELQRETLASLAASPFNKVRMCVFPKRYVYNEDEPGLHAFLRRADGSLDFDRFEPAFFRHLEDRVGALRDLGIEADLILFHPYDVWGYQSMTAEQDERYLRHVVARLSAFRNVWWSVANEFDLMDKTPERWERCFRVLSEVDPGHLASIHNADRMYDYSRPEVTHVSLQSWDVKRTRSWRETYGKPVINDEPEYEGDIPLPWGNISAHELVHRFWITILGGGYAGHGETYLDEHDILWWSKGGRLHGESVPRIAFLRRLLEEAGGPLVPLERSWVWTRVSAATAPGTWLYYFGEHQPRLWTYGLPVEEGPYAVELIDPWAMTMEPLMASPRPPVTGLPGAHDMSGSAFSVELPGRPYLALRVRHR